MRMSAINSYTLIDDDGDRFVKKGLLLIAPYLQTLYTFYLFGRNRVFSKSDKKITLYRRLTLETST